MKEEEEKILNIIRAVRLSFLEAGIVYTMGACYGFYTILKAIYPKASAYSTEEDRHIVTKIDGKFYDIRGEYVDSTLEPVGGLTKLNKKQHDFWEAVISTQPVENILFKKKDHS